MKFTFGSNTFKPFTFASNTLRGAGILLSGAQLVLGPITISANSFTGTGRSFTGGFVVGGVNFSANVGQIGIERTFTADVAHLGVTFSSKAAYAEFFVSAVATLAHSGVLLTSSAIFQPPIVIGPPVTPQTPSAIHLGQGVIQLFIPPPLPPGFRRYEVETAPTIDGPYEGFANRFLYGSTGHLYGYVIGTTVYLRVRSEIVDSTGEVHFSEWQQVRAANVIYVQATMLVEAPAGSVIPEGALFTDMVSNDRIVGFQANSEIIVP